MFQTAEHHPVADIGDAEVGGLAELSNDGVRAAEVETVHKAVIVEFSGVGADLDASVGNFKAVEGAAGPVLPTGVVQQFAGFRIGFGDMGDGLEAQFQAVNGFAQVFAGVD